MTPNTRIRLEPPPSWAEMQRFFIDKFATTGFSAFSEKEKGLINQFIEAKPNHPCSLLSRGYVSWREGNHIEASTHFQSAKRLLALDTTTLDWFDVGVLTWFPEAGQFTQPIAQSLKFRALQDFHFIRRSRNSGRRLTILSCCDDANFVEHKETFFALIQREFADYNVHLHITEPSFETLRALESHPDQNLSVTTDGEFDNDSERCPIAARFFIALALLNASNTDILTLDISAITSKNFRYIVPRLLEEHFDFACQKLATSWMPWISYLATVLLIKNSGKSRQVLKNICHYMAAVPRDMPSRETERFLTQSALYFAIEKGIATDHLTFMPIGHFGRLFLESDPQDSSSFLAIFRSYVRATEASWKFVTPITPLIRQYGGHLTKHTELFNHILSSYEPVSTDDTEYLTNYLLKLYESGLLANSLHDSLLFTILAQKRYDLAISIIRKLRQLKAPPPPYLSNNTFCAGPDLEAKAIEYVTGLLMHGQSQFDLAVSSLAKAYNGSERQTLTDMKIAGIRRLLRLGAIAEAVAEIGTYFSGVVVVVGLQRSGTNYIAELLRVNTNAYVPYSGDTTIFWKHSLPRERTHTNQIFFDPIDALSRLNAYCIVVTKNPISWIESITKRFCADFFRTRRKFVKEKNDIKSMARFYGHFVTSWRNVSPRVFFVEYEAVLTNPDMIFECIPNISKASVSTIIPASVPMSRSFSASDRERYLKEVSSLSNQELEQIEEILCLSRKPWFDGFACTQDVKC